MVEGLPGLRGRKAVDFWKKNHFLSALQCERPSPGAAPTLRGNLSNSAGNQIDFGVRRPSVSDLQSLRPAADIFAITFATRAPHHNISHDSDCDTTAICAITRAISGAGASALISIPLHNISPRTARNLSARPTAAAHHSHRAERTAAALPQAL